VGTALEEAASFLALPLYVGLNLAAFVFDVFDEGGEDDEAWGRAQDRHEQLSSELDASTDAQRPSSGEYWGCSEESDAGDQAVRCSLTFHADGRVTGRGNDGVDGAYRVTRGQWGRPYRKGAARPNGNSKVAWIEEYDDGFSVAVEGQYDAREGKIKARFTSSRGVKGTFVLAPKPSIFRV